IVAYDDYSRRLLRNSGVVGVVVLSVAESSPAERAGLRGLRESRTAILLGDIITAVDGRRVDDVADINAALDQRSFGDRMTMTVLRGDRDVNVTVQLDPPPTPRR